MSELNVFSKIKFPPYKYVPYPRMLYSGVEYGPDGKLLTIGVDNKGEEEALLAKGWFRKQNEALEALGGPSVQELTQEQRNELQVLQDEKAEREKALADEQAKSAALTAKLEAAEKLLAAAQKTATTAKPQVATPPAKT